jgi:uncharacterized protein (DUF488 family)
VGYQGYDPDGFFALLVKSRVKQLIDVRANAISRKKGFSRNALQAACAEHGLTYIHIPELGVPKAIRGTPKTQQDHERIVQRYQTELLPEAASYVGQAAQLVRERTSVLMCFEHEVAFCHRGPLAEAVSKLAELPVRHL